MPSALLLAASDKNSPLMSLSYKCVSRVLCYCAKELVVPVESAHSPARTPLILRGKKRKTLSSLWAILKAVWWKNGWRVVVGAMKFDHVSCEIMHHHHHRPPEGEDIAFSYQQWLNISVHARHFFSSRELQNLPLFSAQISSCPETDDSSDMNHLTSEVLKEGLAFVIDQIQFQTMSSSWATSNLRARSIQDL